MNKPFYVKKCNYYPLGAKTEQDTRKVIYVNRFELYKNNQKVDEVVMPVESEQLSVENTFMRRNHIKDRNEITWRKPIEAICQQPSD